MTAVVLDANVVFKWFTTEEEPGQDEARAVRDQFASGALDVVVPHLLALEVLNVAARKWRWPPEHVAGVATVLDALPWRVADPSAHAVAAWIAAGLTPFDATYVALAESLGGTVLTDDAAMRRIAGRFARPLVD